MLIYFLYGLFILSCIVLVVAVLLQPGKANAGALFSSGISSAAFGPRGTQTLLAKITIGAAVVFMLVALSLSAGADGPTLGAGDSTGRDSAAAAAFACGHNSARRDCLASSAAGCSRGRDHHNGDASAGEQPEPPSVANEVIGARLKY